MTMQNDATLSEQIEIFNARGAAPVLVICDHGNHQVPAPVGDLGVSEELLRLHIGWDIGAADTARALALRLDAVAIINHVSRLVIDANRRPYIETSIPPVSDGCVIPGNHDLSPEQVRERIRDYFLPYHRMVARHLGAFRRRGVVPVLIAIHSFTSRLNGEDRPWQIGILWRSDQRLSAPAIDWLRGHTDLIIGDNQPYSGMKDFGYSITFHGQRTRLPHLMIEIRQDEIETLENAERYAEVLASSLKETLAQTEIYRHYSGNILNELGGIPSWRHASRSSPLA